MFGSAASIVGSAASKVSSSLPGQAGKTGFSESEALKHAKALTEVDPPPVDCEAKLNPSLQYVFKECQTIKETADGEVDVEVDLCPAKSGDSDLKNVVLRVLPKSVSDAKEKSILVSSYVDSVYSAEAGGDDPSNVAVMLELARGLSHSAQGFKNSVIFFFNTGEEDSLNGAHSFITQHPWSNTIRLAIDLDSLVPGGKPSVFKDLLPSGAIKSATDIQVCKEVPGLSGLDFAYTRFFSSGAIKSATDFQVYKEVSDLSGLDFVNTDKTHVYHTKNDKFELLKPGSLQHLGENMLPFLIQAASSPDI